MNINADEIEQTADDDAYINAVENLDDYVIDEMNNMDVDPAARVGVVVPEIAEVGNAPDNDDGAPDTNEESKVVSWTNVSSDNIVTGGQRRQPRKCDSADGYHFTPMGDTMDDFPCAQTAYIQFMETIGHVNTAITFAVNHIILM